MLAGRIQRMLRDRRLICHWNGRLGSASTLGVVGPHPIALSSKGIGRQTDPMWQGGGNPLPYGIEVFPVNSCALDPEREQLLILSFVHPGYDRFLTIFVCRKDVNRIVLFRLPAIPIVSLVCRIGDISA